MQIHLKCSHSPVLLNYNKLSIAIDCQINTDLPTLHDSYHMPSFVSFLEPQEGAWELAKIPINPMNQSINQLSVSQSVSQSKENPSDFQTESERCGLRLRFLHCYPYTRNVSLCGRSLATEITIRGTY